VCDMTHMCDILMWDMTHMCDIDVGHDSYV